MSLSFEIEKIDKTLNEEILTQWHGSSSDRLIEAYDLTYLRFSPVRLITRTELY